MAWIESHQELRDHPKTKKLARLLGVSKVTAIGHLHCLWWWSLDYADDGDLSRFDMPEIADGAEWEGDPDAFHSAMCESGFIDTALSSNKLPVSRVHDWDDYAGKLVEKRAQNAAKQKAWRERHRNSDATTEQRNRNVSVTEPLRNGATQQDTTEQNRTDGPPTPQTPLPPADSDYAETLNGNVPILVEKYLALDPLLNENWLVGFLGRAGPEYGPLPSQQLMTAFGLAHRQIERRIRAPDELPIKHPRRFAEKIIRELLQEQRP